MIFTTRFAPSPTGPLHLGHAYSAILSHDLARQNDGKFLLRIEDIDQSRARPNWEHQIYDDLNWLGLSWPQPVLRQSDQMTSYAAALDTLWMMGLLYPCTCTRRDIQNATSAPQEGVPTHGPDGLIYPGTCRPTTNVTTPRPTGVTLRLNMARACERVTRMDFLETGAHQPPKHVRFTTTDLTKQIGDFVIARREMATSYHLSVVIDDAAQNITDVVRGQDLFEATKIHILLQSLLNLPTPTYHHHRLIRDGFGKRLAKRDDALAIAKYRADGVAPQDIRTMVGL